MFNFKDPLIVQHPGAAVGNFINCTPAIRAISDVLHKPIRVWFSAGHVRDMYQDADFIRIQDQMPPGYKPKGGPKIPEILFQSAEVNREMPDWKFLFNKYAKGVYGYRDEPPHTYVDSVTDRWEPPAKKCTIAVVRGARSAHWHRKKDLGDEVYKHIIEKLLNGGASVVLVGGPEDNDWWMRRMATWDDRIINTAGDDIRKALNVLNFCDFVVCNDSGLYHAAVALKKLTFVMWKSTNPVKNRAPGNYATHSLSPDKWLSEFNTWFNMMSIHFQLTGHKRNYESTSTSAAA